VEDPGVLLFGWRVRATVLLISLEGRKYHPNYQTATQLQRYTDQIDVAAADMQTCTGKETILNFDGIMDDTGLRK
jgi:hypothetical protein